MRIFTFDDVVAMPRRMPSWLSASDDPLAAGIVLHAKSFVGECEEPPSSNSGPMIDVWNLAAGAALNSFWCGSFATAMWRDCGAETAGRGHDPSCDLLMQWCIRTNRFSKAPALGAFIFYGVPGDARHVEIVSRVKPYLCTIGGNAAWGGAFTTNGEAVVSRRIDPKSKTILGYGHVRARLAPKEHLSI